MDDAKTMALGLALEGVVDMKAGFSIAEVAEVEAAWSRADADLATYGFVLRLVSGGRHYAEVTLDDTVATKGEAEIELLDLEDGIDLPELDGASWATDVEHLNRRLAQLKRQ